MHSSAPPDNIVELILLSALCNLYAIYFLHKPSIQEHSRSSYIHIIFSSCTYWRILRSEILTRKRTAQKGGHHELYTLWHAFRSECPFLSKLRPTGPGHYSGKCGFQSCAALPAVCAGACNGEQPDQPCRTLAGPTSPTNGVFPATNAILSTNSACRSAKPACSVPTRHYAERCANHAPRNACRSR